MIIGISGKNCSGKDTAANYLKTLGFECLSLSDAIRDELKAKGAEITRENLIAEANHMREKFGNDIFAKRIIKKIKEGKNYAIVSIRNPGEVEALRSLEGFMLLNINANARARFGRMKQRARESDPKTLEEFEALEEKERSSQNPAAQQLDLVEKMADARIENNSSPQDLHLQINALLKNIKKEA